MNLDFNACSRQIISNLAMPFRIGNLRLQIVSFHEDELPLFATREHSHPFFEFSLMHKGTLSYVINGQTFSLTSGNQQIALIPPLTAHRRLTKGPSITLNGHLLLTPMNQAHEEVMNLFKMSVETNNYCFKLPKSFFSLDQQLSQVIHRQDPYWLERGSCKLMEYFISFFTSIYDQMNVPEHVSPSMIHQELLDRLFYTIRIHTSRPLDVKAHANFLGMSERQLSRLLQKEYGMPLGRFIMQQRIDYAKHLLANGTSMIKDIAYSLGFSDASHFCRVFKTYTGMTPRQYVQGLHIKADPI